MATHKVVRVGSAAAVLLAGRGGRTARARPSPARRRRERRGRGPTARRAARSRARRSRAPPARSASLLVGELDAIGGGRRADSVLAPIPVPLAVVGDRLATGLLDVTDDLAALDSSGIWAVVLPFDGRPVCARFTPCARPAIRGAVGRGRASTRRMAVVARPARRSRTASLDPRRHRRGRRVPGEPDPSPLRARSAGGRRGRARARRWPTATRPRSPRWCACRARRRGGVGLARAVPRAAATGSGRHPSRARRPTSTASCRRTSPRT